MAKRNYVEEILSIRLRNDLNPRWGGALIQLQALEKALQNTADIPAEMVRYFPIAIVATMEAYFRSAIRELIDFGPPFSGNAAGFDKTRALPLDFRTVLAILGKTITLGDLVSHLLPFKSLEDIDRNMTTILGHGFLGRLKKIQDRWAIEIEGATPKPIIDNPSEVYRDVNQTFRLRHTYCHELAFSEKADPALIARCFISSSLFLKAADQMIWDLVAPNAPLTQSGMSARAIEELAEADEELKRLSAGIASYQNKEENEELARTQAAWGAFRELQANSYANRWGKGGTVWPTLKSRNETTTTRLRIGELQRELERLQKGR
jgi:uncharacterized protein YecT (DUF1311 family)